MLWYTPERNLFTHVQHRLNRRSCERRRRLITLGSLVARAQATTQKETGYPDEDSSVSEDEIPFEPFDVNNDGSVRKTASRPSKGSWRRPEVGWDVTITVHRFRELIPKISQGAVAEGEEDSKICVKEVEPNARVELRLGDDAFTQVR